MNTDNIFALLIGKKNSTGFPGKNVMNINGLPSCEYGFQAAKRLNIKNIFVSTDCPVISKIGSKYSAHLIERPQNLATPEALTEDVLVHAYNEILKLKKKPEIIVLLFANNPAISIELIRSGIRKLLEDNSYDSAFSVSKYNMFSPTRARKLVEDKIESFIPLKLIGNVNSIRSSQGDVYFCDLSVQVIRGEVFENMSEGMQPFQWMGKKSYPLKNSFGFDIDEEWQKTAIEVWLKKNWKYE
jgi:CMP-N-acetylneuraminic acid synthetase